MSEENIQQPSSGAGSYPLLQEYPLNSNLLQLIPARAQRALSTFDIEFTCIDADGHYIAIGTNIGIVYLLDRRKNQVIRLKNDFKEAITCVKILISLECLVVFGCKNGAVFVVKVPFSGDEELEKFTVEGLHSAPITALEWAKNGMKFFSGDENGIVVCTEIDHFEHQSRSHMVLNGESKIIQLSYNRLCLLVSTLLQSVIYSCEDNVTTRIGQKERKCFGPFGAILFQSNVADGIVYASRPGQRLWKSDKTGVIQETMIFKAALCEAHTVIPLLGGRVKPCDFSEVQFGQLFLFSDKYILISSDCTFILIDPEQKSLMSSCTKLFPIVDVTTCYEEIFVLRGLRQLIRISSHPDPYATERVPEEPSLIEDILVPFKELSTFVKERSDTFTAQAESSHIFEWLKRKRSASSPDVMPTNQAQLNNSESLPELVKLDSGDCTAVILDNSVISPVNNIPALEITSAGQNESDDIVYKPKKKHKNRKVRFRSASPKNRKSSDSVPGQKNTLMVDQSVITSNPSGELSDENTDFNNSLVPSSDERDLKEKSDETFKEAVVNQNLTANNAVPSNDLSMDIYSKDKSGVNTCSDSSNPIIEENSANSVSAYNPLAQDTDINSNDSTFTSQEENTSINQLTNYNDNSLEENTDSDDIYLSFDTSKHTPVDVELTIQSDSTEYSCKELSDTSTETIEVGPPKYGVDWVEYKAPEVLLDLCLSNHHIFCVDVRNKLFFSNYPVLGLQWRDISQPAEKIAVSPTESIVWALYKGTVFAAMQKSSTRWFDVEWRSIAQNIVSIAVEDDCGWYVTSAGKLVMQPNLKSSQPYGYPQSIPCDSTILQVASRNGVVWVLSTDGRLHNLDRRNKYNYNLEDIKVNEVPDIDSVFLGVQQTGWIVDSSGIIRFLIGVTPDTPAGIGKAWEVEASKYCVEHTTHLQKALQVLNNETFTSLIRGKQHICLSTSVSGVWFCKTLDNLLYSNQKNIIGHTWDLLVPIGSATTTKWSYISAANVSNSKGSLWCLNRTGELFCVCTSTKVPVAVELPSRYNICCFAPTADSLWVLTENGEIFFRKGMTATCPEGVRWQTLNLTQLGEEQIICISCSPEASWACTNSGSVLMRLGSLCPSSTRSLPQAWIPISTGKEDLVSPILDKLSAIGKKFPLPLVHPSAGLVLCKVYVGPLGYPVWALDNRSNIYVREGVSASLPVGKKWTFVPELQAKELGISRDAVWLLKHSGEIYRRFNVSEKNPCGDYWKQIPGNSDHLSVTADDDLWSLKDDRIFLHSSFVLSFDSHDTSNKIPAVRSISEDDWEDIMVDFDADSL